ncbi:MAG TPA: glycine cleavage system aminomethyltransferase GcvT [Burkholderiales bacterium]|nr:glycine cleavage system aminomethyltransferase GcvT [Burkholderiales bacterium]
MLHTPLIDAHRKAGAKLVDFAGWEMPLHYGSQIEEHHAVRRTAGMFDTSHMLAIDVEGHGARAFLSRALANDVGRLAQPGRALYSCMLNERGGILDDLIVYFLREGLFRVVVNAATAEKDLVWLGSLAAGAAQLRPRRELAMIAVQGPQARARTWSALPVLRAKSEGLAPFCGAQAGDTFVARTGYTGEDGFELLMPADSASAAWQRLAQAGVRPCGLGARDTLRLEAGMNLYGQDMDESVTPLECGLGWTVELASGHEFVGKTALAARSPAHARFGLVLEERAGVLRAHQAVHGAHGAGEVTSGTFSPTLQASIALARLPPGYAPGERVEVDLRGKRAVARVVRPPFVRHGKVLV